MAIAVAAGVDRIAGTIGVGEARHTYLLGVIADLLVPARLLVGLRALHTGGSGGSREADRVAGVGTPAVIEARRARVRRGIAKRLGGTGTVAVLRAADALMGIGSGHTHRRGTPAPRPATQTRSARFRGRVANARRTIGILETVHADVVACQRIDLAHRTSWAMRIYLARYADIALRAIGSSITPGAVSVVNTGKAGER